MSSPLPSFPAIRLAEDHRREQLAIRARFLPTLLDLWKMLAFGDLRGTLAPWALQTAGAVIRAHQQSAQAGARYYRDARALPRPTRPDPNPAGIELPPRVVPPADRSVPRRVQGFDPTPTEPIDLAEVRRRLTGAAVGRAAEVRRAGVTNPERIEREALAETTRTASLLVLDGGRTTVDNAIRADADAIGWCRLTDDNPCAFCAMQASRGFVFKTAASAGEKYHPGCACTPMARFRGEDSPLPPMNRELSELWGRTAGHFGAQHYPGDNGKAARRAWRRALEAHQRGEDPVEAAWTDTKGQGRKGGKPAGEPDHLPPRPDETAGRRKRTRSGADQDAKTRKRLTNMEQALEQLEARREGGEDNLDDLIDFHREEIERLRRRVGDRITPDEALAALAA